jgi:hypothetical protein
MRRGDTARPPRQAERGRSGPGPAVRRMRPGRGSVAGRARALIATLVALAGPAHAATLQTLDGALAQAFPLARIEKRTLALSEADQKAVSARAHARCDARLVTAYVAWRGDTLAGAAFTDRRTVRTREALLFVAVAPDSSIARIEVLAFFEPPDYRPPPRWLARFAHRRQDARLAPGGAVPNLAGATLTSRSVAESARLALAWHELLLAPALARVTDKPGLSRPMGGDHP